MTLQQPIPPSTAAANQGSVLQRTIAMLFSDIIAASDELLERGADLAALNDIKAHSDEAEKYFLEGKMFCCKLV
jgi:hypothetical protein